MSKVYIIGECRTPIGKFNKSLKKFSSIDLGSFVVQDLVKRTKINIKEIEHVIFGCTLQAGLGQNITRQIAIKSGLSNSVTAETINIVCGSGLQSVNNAARLIKLGLYDVIIAGGVESMSNAPFVNNRDNHSNNVYKPIDSMLNDALWDKFYDCHMGITVEKLAEKFNISREEMDEYSYSSHKKANDAIINHCFNNEIVKILCDEKIIDTDECVRSDTTLEKLAALKPAFSENGKLTAGNSSALSDGAAAVLLISEKKLKELLLKPSFEWIDSELVGIDPIDMGMAPAISTKRLLERNNLSITNIDLVELNEAFAAQSLIVQKELKIPNRKLNINGGAIALGHPIGATGSIILVKLINEMKKNNGKLGLASLCIGGGMGVSTIIKQV